MAGNKIHILRATSTLIICLYLRLQSSNPQELERALDEALNTGYRHIDTAYVYQNEQLIGHVLKRWFDSGKIKREELFIVTKVIL